MLRTMLIEYGLASGTVDDVKLWRGAIGNDRPSGIAPRPRCIGAGPVDAIHLWDARLRTEPRGWGGRDPLGFDGGVNSQSRESGRPVRVRV